MKMLNQRHNRHQQARGDVRGDEEPPYLPKFAFLYFATRAPIAGPLGRMVLTVLGMVAEMELGFIKERQAAGIAKAKANGVYKGRPVRLNHAQIKTLRSQGLGATAIAKQLGCSRGAIYKALNAT
jgi:DNA invertase Pin-like site-specific DNA recombinase